MLTPRAQALFVHLARAAVTLAAVYYLVVLVAVAGVRLTYPYQLEWIEGVTVENILRIRQGQTLYVAPSLDYIPNVYTPLYFYLSALLSYPLGVGFVAPRLVSLVATLACLALIYRLAWIQTRNHWSGILAAGLFAATYRHSGAWLDLARVDTLFLALFLVGVYALRVSLGPNSASSPPGAASSTPPSLPGKGAGGLGSPLAAVLAGLLFGLAFLTKQAALALAAPMLALLFFTRRRQAILATLTLLAVVGASAIWLNGQSGGWYSYYAFYLPGTRPLVPTMLVSFWTQDVGSYTSIALVMSTLFLLTPLFRLSAGQPWLYAMIALGALAGTFLSRLRDGGFVNVLIPIYAVMTLLMGVQIQRLLSFAQGLDRERRSLAEMAVYLLCLAQAIALFYNPLTVLPTPAQREAGRQLVQTIGQFDGEVYTPLHAYIPRLAGKQSYAHAQAIVELLGGGGEPAARLQTELREAIRQQRFAAIITNDPALLPGLEENYILTPRVIESALLAASAGGPPRREFIYIPR